MTEAVSGLRAPEIQVQSVADESAVKRRTSAVKIMTLKEIEKMETLIRQRYNDATGQLSYARQQAEDMVKAAPFSKKEEMDNLASLVNTQEVLLSEVTSDKESELEAADAMLREEYERFLKKQTDAKTAFEKKQQEIKVQLRSEINQKFETLVRDRTKTISDLKVKMELLTKEGEREAAAQRTAIKARVQLVESWLSDQVTAAVEYLYTEKNDADVARKALSMLPASIKIREVLQGAQLVLSTEQLKQLPQVANACKKCGKDARYFEFLDHGKIRCTYCGQYDCVDLDPKYRDVLSSFQQFDKMKLLNETNPTNA